jgi:hypothetical protein
MRERFEAKRAAGWTTYRRDGSCYSGALDEIAGKAEQWAATCCGEQPDRNVYLHGDGGCDFVSNGVRIDVVHIGNNRNPLYAHLIVNIGNPKLSGADVYLVVANRGNCWYAVGAISREAFIARTVRKDFGFGEKLALPCCDLEAAKTLIPQFCGDEWKRPSLCRAPTVRQVR